MFFFLTCEVSLNIFQQNVLFPLPKIHLKFEDVNDIKRNQTALKTRYNQYLAQSRKNEAACEDRTL